MSPDVLSLCLRALLFLCLFQAAGGVVFLILFADRLAHSELFIRRVARYSAAGGMLLIMAHQAIEAARFADDYTGLLDPRLQQLALWSSGGVAHAAQGLGLLLIAVGLWRTKLTGKRMAGAGAALVVASFALTGHTSVNHLRWLLAPLLCGHLAIVAFWFGALVPLLITLQRESRRDAHEVFERFSRLGTWLVPGIAVAGLAMALVLVPDLSVLLQPYGELLALKLALFCLLMIPAALNKWRFVPALAGAASHNGAGSLRRSIVIEYALIVTVLCVTAALTTFYSPEA